MVAALDVVRAEGVGSGCNGAQPEKRQHPMPDIRIMKRMVLSNDSKDNNALD